MSESDPFAPKTPREIANELQVKADEAKKFADDFEASQEVSKSDPVTVPTSAAVRVVSTPVVSVNG